MKLKGTPQDSQGKIQNWIDSPYVALLKKYMDFIKHEEGRLTLTI
jgi:hypothetical protein